MIFDNEQEYLLWAKKEAWEVGISPREFKKCQLRDIRDVLDLKNEIVIKGERERELNNLIIKNRI